MLFRLICLLVALPQFLLAWGANGHRVVAKIAYDNLTPAARARVDAALGDNYLSQVSTWPDYVRAERGWDFAKPWHYMTVQPDETIDGVARANARNDEVDDVREAIDLMTAVLAGDAVARQTFTELTRQNKAGLLSGSLDATALAYLIHMIGDLHMPLHVGKNRDLGGNKIIVQFFGERQNLHAVWDTHILERENLSYTEFAAYATIHTRARRADWEDDPITDWIAESIALRETIYNTLYDRTDRDSGLPDLSWDYQHDFLPVVEDRLAAAGYRAAVVLNKIYGE